MTNVPIHAVQRDDPRIDLACHARPAAKSARASNPAT
jgi:hypothetical protein